MNGRPDHSEGRPVAALIVFVLVLVGAIASLSLAPVNVGGLLDPVDGLWGGARAADAPMSEVLDIEALEAPVEIRRDSRGVPHIFAESDRDATIALGWVVARDRLFQMEFLKRLATGRLAELVGDSAVGTDRYFRSIGMPRTVQRNISEHNRQGGRRAEILDWYAAGVNAWIDRLQPGEYPFEYRLFGAAPERYDASNLYGLLAYMTFDLSFRSNDIAYSRAASRLGNDVFDALYPVYSDWEVPIVEEGLCDCPFDDDVKAAAPPDGDRRALTTGATDQVSRPHDGLLAVLAEGLIEGKGSNNWAVNGDRSSTGMPILAGDMHLSLSLPAIWYEAHLVTPDMNVYGVTFPNAPSIVEGITPTTAWTFTNAGTDQLDTYLLDPTRDGTGYRFEDDVLPFETEIDTIHVAGGDFVVDTLRISRFGPVMEEGDSLYALRWVGHEFGRTFDAVWDMNRASNYHEFEEAIRQWDYPMQNILYAGADSIIAIRSTGYLPIRASGSGFGVLDGTSSDDDWIGRVAFDELPHMISPDRGYATSTNQRPAGEWYPHYLGRDWDSIYRSIRIDSLLSGKAEHSPADLMRYQSDVRAVQADLFLPLTERLEDLSPAAASVRERLLAWDRVMSVDSEEATIFHWFMDALGESLWDEALLADLPGPADVRVLDARTRPGIARLLGSTGSSVEDRLDTLLTGALAEAARHTRDDVPEWGDIHGVEFSHITGAGPLHPLDRGPYPYPGTNETLSPGRGLIVSHSASWRVVVDFSTSPPKAWGVYPGGQSGNPFSPLYDAHLPAFLNFRYYPLSLADRPKDVPIDVVPVGPDQLGR